MNAVCRLLFTVDITDISDGSYGLLYVVLVLLSLCLSLYLVIFLWCSAFHSCIANHCRTHFGCSYCIICLLLADLHLQAVCLCFELIFLTRTSVIIT